MCAMLRGWAKVMEGKAKMASEKSKTDWLRGERPAQNFRSPFAWYGRRRRVYSRVQKMTD